MGEHTRTAASRRRDLRLALAGMVVPVLVAVATSSFSHDAPFLVGAAAACIVPVIVTLFGRRHRAVFWVAAFAGIPALTLMQANTGGAGSGYSVLLMMGMLWFGLQASRREVLVGAAMLVACSYLPMLIVGPPAYPAQWGPATMLVLIGCTTAATLQTVKGETHQMARRLRQEAVIDELTGVLNRRGWRDMASVEFARAKHRRGPIALVTIDLDQFKELNDKHGHDYGDCALSELAHWMQAAFRTRDVLARLGGDEFVVLLTDATIDGAISALARLRDAPLRTSFSAGVAVWDGREDLVSLMHRSDRALYAAKSDGGHRTFVAAPLRASDLRPLAVHAA